MTRAWLNTSMLDSAVWVHRLCVAVELPGDRVLYITEGGGFHIEEFDEPVCMPYTWAEL